MREHVVIAPLKPARLKAAIAAFMDVPTEAIKLEHETGSIRKAIARAIRAYEREAEPHVEAAE